MRRPCKVNKGGGGLIEGVATPIGRQREADNIPVLADARIGEGMAPPTNLRRLSSPQACRQRYKVADQVGNQPGVTIAQSGRPEQMRRTADPGEADRAGVTTFCRDSRSKRSKMRRSRSASPTPSSGMTTQYSWASRASISGPVNPDQ
jgi:hypothetical protein